MNVWVLFYQLLPITFALFAILMMLISPTPRQMGVGIKWGGLALILSIVYDLIMVNLGIWNYPMDELIWNIPLPLYFLSVLIYGASVYIGLLKIKDQAPITFWILICSIPVLGVIRNFWGGMYLAPDLISWQTPFWVIFELGYWIFAYTLPIIPLLQEYDLRMKNDKM